MVGTSAHFAVDVLERQADELRDKFVNAKPFPHLVLDGLLRLPPDVADEFPQPDWDGWSGLGDTYQHNKFFCDDIERIPPVFAALIDELSRPRFLRALEAVTGIKRLLPDPYLTGGGIHLSGPGGILSPHTDFHHYRALDLYRRVNLLIYLNQSWQESDGGCLELGDPDASGGSVARQLVVPAFGRCVIFQTDDKSVHGFPVPIAEGRWRKSIALYYYTAAEASTFSGDATTYWREHGEQSGVRKVRMAAYRALLQSSRGLSMLAHLVNPNQGTKLLRTRMANRRKRDQER